MRVFIGWSGDTSHDVAMAFRDWLPKVIQAIKPFVSSEDIAKGARWSGAVAKELQGSDYGIICVTRDNVETAWINFEAGALSKEIEKAFVAPFLFELKTSEILGPLSQFMAVQNDKHEISQMLMNINERQEPAQRLEKSVVEDAFNTYWPQLEGKLRGIAQESKKPDSPKRKPEELLAEILDSVRLQLRRSESAQDSTRRAIEQIMTGIVTRIESLGARVDALGRSVESLHTQPILPSDIWATDEFDFSTPEKMEPATSTPSSGSPTEISPIRRILRAKAIQEVMDKQKK
jgi:hypothetical protein